MFLRSIFSLRIFCGLGAGILFGSVSNAAGGDVVGKLTVGYQGWFSCGGDGSPLDRWFHWGTAAERGKISFELWPDVREFDKTYPTKFAPLGNGQPAALYSSYDDQVVATHFRWMREHGIDGAALQRFGAELKDPAIKAQRDGMTRKVRTAAQASGRKFYVMYDLSGWRGFPTAIKTDWTDVMLKELAITKSPAYAREAGRPVVCIWGIGFRDRPGNASEWLDVIRWFQARGCYVIGGVPVDWRKRKELSAVFDACDMITPWTVGAYRWPVEVAAHKKREAEDLAYLDSRGIAYQPVVFPGFAWSNWNGGERNAFPRRHGDFLWQQFTNLRELGIRTAYVAMFDEFDEGTAIAKAAEDASMAPGDQYFLTLDADGVECSADFYLRLVRDGARMIKGAAPLESAHPTPHREPVFMLGTAQDERGIEMAAGPAGPKINLAAADGRTSQRFRFVPTDDGHFRILPPIGEPESDDANHRGDFVAASGGWLKLRNVGSGRVLELTPAGAAFGLRPAADTGRFDQRWRLIPVGEYGIRSTDGKGLRVSENGREIAFADPKNLPTFRWKFTNSGRTHLAVTNAADGDVIVAASAQRGFGLAPNTRKAASVSLLPLPFGRFQILSGDSAWLAGPDGSLKSAAPNLSAADQGFVLDRGKESAAGN